MTKKIELLAPAGSLKTMRFAFAYGADAVYAGAARYSLRMRGNEFNDDNIKLAIDEAHAQGKQFFLTVNTMPHNYKLTTAIRDLKTAILAAPDALIMADPGLMLLVRENFPQVAIHLSVQANTLNWATVKFWQSVGVERVILSRELSLKEIEEIRQRCPDMQLEVFVHGALCIAYSGRCLLSGYFNNRDPNQGTCTNACRWKYKPLKSATTAEGAAVPIGENIININELSAKAPRQARHPLADEIYFLEEEQRRGEYMEISEDENGTYIMNSRDLRAVEHVAALVNIGIDCLKIEGRTKSHYYAARTTQIYRRAIDDACAGKEFNSDLSVQLEGLANRGYTDGFFVRRQIKAQQNYQSGSSNSATQQFVGEVIDYDAQSGLATVAAKNKFSQGDAVELIMPRGNRRVILGDLYDYKNCTSVTSANGSGWIIKTDLGEVDNYTLLARYL